MQVNRPTAASASRLSGYYHVRLSASALFRIRRNAFLRHFNLAFTAHVCPVNDSGTAIIASSGPSATIHRREHPHLDRYRSHGQRRERVFVVLHYNHGITEIAQMDNVPNRRSLSRWCRPIDGSSSNTSRQPGPHQSGSPDEYAVLTARKCLCRAGKCQVIQAYVKRNFRRSPISLRIFSAIFARYLRV